MYVLPEKGDHIILFKVEAQQSNMVQRDQRGGRRKQSPRKHNNDGF